MSYAPEADLAPYAAWGIDVPAEDGPSVFQSFAQADAGGPVDLTGFRLEGRLAWEGGAIDLSTEAGSILIDEDQVGMRGWFSVEIPVPLARTLPRDLPVTYAFRVDDGEGFGPPILRGQVYPNWGAFG